MVSFQEQLQQEIQRLDSGGGNDFEDVERPYDSLKHDQLYFDKNNTEFLVRILPPKDDNSFFAVGFNEFYMQVTNNNGKQLGEFITLPLQLDPMGSEFQAKVAQWQENENMPNQYPSSRISKRYYLNVVRLQSNGGGNYSHEMDANGQVMVRVIKLPQSAYQSILEDLADENIQQPEGATDDYGMLSGQNAYPFRIWKTGQRLDTEYHTRVYEHDLGPLPNGWENELEDLNNLATPSEEYNSEWISYLTAVHEGREGEYNANRNNGSQTQNAPQQNQGNFGNFNNGGQQNAVTEEDMGHIPSKNEAPQQGTNGFGAPQQGGSNFNQPQQGQDNFGQPQQGSQQQAPQQNQGNFGNFNNGGQTQQEPQGQPQQGNQQPEQSKQPAPQPTQQSQPQTQGDGVPDVDDLLAQVRNEADNQN